MFIYIICLIIFLINLAYMAKYSKEKRTFKTWYDNIPNTRFVPENEKLLSTIFKKQGFDCNCWTNESIKAYKNSDECGKEGLISFHKLVYHTKK